MYWFEMLPEMPEAFFTGLQEVMIMAFFDSMKETLTTAGRDVSQKAKEVSGVAKLKLDIKENATMICTRKAKWQMSRWQTSAHF